MLGQATCNECEGVKTLEVRGKGELWSRCLKCGFEEWEWLHGDDPEYLNLLAERYGVSVAEIKQALKEKIELPTEIQKTIVDQLRRLNPLFIPEYGIKTILWKEDGRSVRLHTRNRGIVINIDIIYKPVPDLYDIEAYRVDGLDCKRIADVKYVYFFEMHSVIRSILDKEVP